MAEYSYNEVQSVVLNNPLLFDNSIPCGKSYIFHEDGTGIFILKGITNNCFARYQVTLNGNVAIPEGGEVTPIALALAVNGEPRVTSQAIYTPAAVDEYGNLTSTAIVTVPRGCCFTLSARYVAADETATPVIEVQNMNLVINRVA